MELTALINYLNSKDFFWTNLFFVCRALLPRLLEGFKRLCASVKNGTRQALALAKRAKESNRPANTGLATLSPSFGRGSGSSVGRADTRIQSISSAAAGHKNINPNYEQFIQCGAN